jgi:hypothetical protein
MGRKVFDGAIACSFSILI